MSKPGMAAFPYVLPLPENWSELNHGITTREYFAARAPAEPAKWFEPVLQGTPPAPWKTFKERMHEEREKYQGDKRYLYANDPDIVAARINEECNAHEAELKKWNDERIRQTLIQWPWAWADAVLAAGAGDTTMPEKHKVAVFLLAAAREIIGSAHSADYNQPLPDWKTAADDWCEAFREFIKKGGPS